MICDTFMFFNELDVLEIRLHELSDVVDRFVLVESPRTFTNKPKPCYYADHKERFADFHDRLMYVRADDFDSVNMGNPWDVEAYHRRCLLQGLQDCKPDDVIMMSDVDEIPRPDVVHDRAGNDIAESELHKGIGHIRILVESGTQPHRIWCLDSAQINP